ncbi:hypothetical protein RF11_14510 [Thelohanellus kitauei]|uniref:Uncharacterized protein n=1 Tax=Thelohanellus kitauei TaxID=669202 RepID=A0A0C2JSN8_THEKT|nr:hypothetical protein RF11_14510 [Thelohanellus kitauei]
MDLQSTDGQRWCNLSCKSTDRRTLIELSECSISLGDLKYSLVRNLSMMYILKFRKDTNYEFSRYKLNYKFENHGYDKETHPLEITINTFNVQLGLSEDICKIPSIEKQCMTNIDIQTNSTELIYPCPKNDSVITTTEFFTTDTTITTTTPLTSKMPYESTLSTKLGAPFSSNNNGKTITSRSSEERTNGYTSHKDEKRKLKSFTTYPKDDHATTILKMASKTQKNEFISTDKPKLEKKYVSNLPTNNHKEKSMAKNTESINLDDSKETTVSITSDTFFTTLETSQDIREKLQFLQYFELKDYFLFFLMILAVAIMVVEIKSRRKISKQLRNFLFHV